jgi:site-specific recombinase XerD
MVPKWRILRIVRFNPNNERIKREYFEFLRQADQKSETTVRGIEKSLLRFEEHCEFADFTKFKAGQGMSFKKALARPPAGSKALSPATIHSTLTAVQRFLRWLICQPGFKSKIKATDINYLNLSEKDVRAASSSPSKSYPTLEQLRHVLALMPAETETERRDRVVFALIMLTGIRDNAAASLRIKHVDLERMLILQDPTDVRTKNSKLIETVLLPLGEEVEGALIDWVAYLREQLLYGGDDPLSRRRRAPMIPSAASEKAA